MKNVSILVDFATAHCRLATTIVCGEVVAETEKAVKIEARTIKTDKVVSAWLPKKALTKPTVRKAGETEYTAFVLAKWFKPAGWTKDFLNVCANTTVISA